MVNYDFDNLLDKYSLCVCVCVRGCVHDVSVHCVCVCVMMRVPSRELSHAVPDMSIHGSLSSVHCSLDLEHYQLIRGLLENNLGEPIEEFLRPYNLQDPSSYVRSPKHTHTDARMHVLMLPMSAVLLITS